MNRITYGRRPAAAAAALARSMTRFSVHAAQLATLENLRQSAKVIVFACRENVATA
jgi:hypothetical protein